MDPVVVGLLVPLGAFAMIFGIIYIGITARNKERMALIEKGADPKLFESIKKENSPGTLKWGMFLLGIGLGIVIAEMMVKSDTMDEGAAYPAMICVFGGLALIGTHLLQRKHEKEDEMKI